MPILNGTSTSGRWIQFSVLLFMVFHLLFKIVEIGSPGIFIFGAFMFLMVYSYTALMDRDPNAIWMEAIKSVIGLGIIFSTKSWFGIDQFISGGSMIMAVYFILSTVVVAYFVRNEIRWNREDRQVLESEGV